MRLKLDSVRRVTAFAVALIMCLCSYPSPAQQSPPSCPDGGPDRSVVFIHGELAKGSNFTQELEPGMQFSLEAVPLGWRLQVRDERGLDLSAMTPPRMGPNPRDIVGWHFRDAENRGPNTGSVNAPQRLRLFEFEPGFKGTAGVKAPPDAALAAGSGRGWLFVDGLGIDALTNTELDERASAVWLRFSACLSWPKTDSGPLEAATAFASEDLELLNACGLPTDWTPSSWLSPPLLGGDFDDDGALDYAAPVQHVDGTRAIVVCLAGTWMNMLPPDDALLEDATTVDQIETWHLVDTPRGSPDEIRLIRAEKSEHAVWAENRRLRARTIYRLETPEP